MGIRGAGEKLRQPGLIQIAAADELARQLFNVGCFGWMTLPPVLNGAAAPPLVQGIAQFILHDANGLAGFAGADAIDAFGEQTAEIFGLSHFSHSPE